MCCSTGRTFRPADSAVRTRREPPGRYLAGIGVGVVGSIATPCGKELPRCARARSERRA